MSAETLSFQAEVAKLLDIVVHSLYSDREIFLRELVSNASDACDRLRHLALTEPSLTEGGIDYRITVTPNAAANSLTIADNGVGMNRDELIANLGTIAKSGTADFLRQLGDKGAKDSHQIGQFGVGFYSAFMVADRVEVRSRKAGESAGWLWESDGKGAFTVTEAEGVERGASITLFLKDDAKEFAEAYKLRQVIKRYSDHIAFPVVLVEAEKDETVNAASALWTRSKAEITPEQYKEFYHHAAHAFDDPWLTLHYKAEGAIEYTGLLFVPSSKPFDLFEPGRRSHLKLYVKRVFITDQVEDFLPGWLRFLRGVVDTPDLPLNVSRELLQHNPLLAKIKTGLVKRVLSELKKKSEDAESNYGEFWETFGPVLKEGLYEDRERQEDLLPLCRFHSTHGEGWTSLDEVVARMKPEQDAIYVITGDDPATIRRSPQLEGFAARGLEVLLLTDPIDDFWLSAVSQYKDKPFRSVTEAGDDLAKFPLPDDAAKVDDAPDAPKASDADVESLTAALKLALGEAVSDVKVSDRLTSSAVCLVAGKGQMSMHLEKMLRAHNQSMPAPKRVLEINPGHALIKALASVLATQGSSDGFVDQAFLLLDQARILEGELPADPVAFASRMAAAMAKALN